MKTVFKNIGVLFDLDGVVLDTEGIYTRFWREIDKLYPTHVEHFSEVIKGSNLETILNTYFPKELHCRIIEILDGFQREMKYEFFPGVEEFITQLHDNHIPMCIVTSSDNKKMQAVYAQHPGFRQLFDHVIVGEMVSKPKPSPECFLTAAAYLGVNITDCYIFEDSLNGLDAAQASGGKVIGLATTNPHEVIEGKAHKIIDSFVGLTMSDMLEL